MDVGWAPLGADDAAVVRRWCRAFLVDHLRYWRDGAALPWDDDDILRHIDAHGLEDRDVRRLYEAASRWETNLVAVARDGGPVGAIWAETSRDPFLCREVGVIAWIYVEPHARGQGVGGRLVGVARDWMRDRGLDVAMLHVTAANPAAVRMYEKTGFRVVDHRMMAPLGAPPASTL